MKEAVERTKNIGFSFIQNDSLIILQPQFTIPDNDKLRHQHVTLVLMVPEGKEVNMGYNLDVLMPHAKMRNDKHYSNEKMLGHTWAMHESRLNCSNCGF